MNSSTVTRTDTPRSWNRFSMRLARSAGHKWGGAEAAKLGENARRSACNVRHHPEPLGRELALTRLLRGSRLHPRRQSSTFPVRWRICRLDRKGGLRRGSGLLLSPFLAIALLPEHLVGPGLPLVPGDRARVWTEVNARGGVPGPTAVGMVSGWTGDALLAGRVIRAAAGDTDSDGPGWSYQSHRFFGLAVPAAAR